MTETDIRCQGHNCGVGPGVDGGVGPGGVDGVDGGMEAKSKAKKKLAAMFKDESSWVQICTPYHIFLIDKDFRRYDERNFIKNCLP